MFIQTFSTKRKDISRKKCFKISSNHKFPPFNAFRNNFLLDIIKIIGSLSCKYFMKISEFFKPQVLVHYMHIMTKFISFVCSIACIISFVFLPGISWRSSHVVENVIKSWLLMHVFHDDNVYLYLVYMS